MTDPVCARCATPIVDSATIRKRDGKVYCCANCLAAAEGARGGALACAHCGTPIVDASSEVDVDEQVFCCVNCAEVDASVTVRGDVA